MTVSTEFAHDIAALGRRRSLSVPSGRRDERTAAYLWLRHNLVDRPAALLLLMLLMPAMLALGVCVMLSDPGPPIVKLTRVGKGGQPFGQFKFRTMRRHAAGPSITMGHDNRVTRLGSFLRRHRLDELPQLFNVVLGEMTLLGPRPEAPEFVDLDDPQWREALRVAPGLAGPAQPYFAAAEPLLLRGPDALSVYRKTVLPAKLAVDVWYVQHAGPRTDLLVMRAAVTAALSSSFNEPAERLARLMPMHPHDDLALRGVETVRQDAPSLFAAS